MRASTLFSCRAAAAAAAVIKFDTRFRYQEAVDAEHDCCEAVYNSAIVNRHLGRLPESRGLLQKYLKLVPGAPDAMFLLAQVCDAIRDSIPKDKPSAAQQQQIEALAHESSRLYKDVARELPSDPSANSSYAHHLQAVEQEDGEAFHYMGEAHKHFPVDLDVVSWLGAYYVKSEMYEEAMAYFVRASYIQPKEKKWKLMVASCHRRVGAVQQALQVQHSASALCRCTPR
jgi:intraflagellar transport protein 88